MFTDDLLLIDHHCHGVIDQPLGRDRFEDLASESPYPPPRGTSHLDTPLGLVLRRWCAPLLDLEPHATSDEYLARRQALLPAEVNRRFLRAAGLSRLLLDTGYRSADILGPAEMATAAAVPAHEVIRLETVAEATLAAVGSAEAYPRAFEESLATATVDAIGLKTIIAYRGGFDFDQRTPSAPSVVAAAGEFLRGREAGHQRLTDPTLLGFGLWTGINLARERGLPIQVHVGYGDPDITLHLTNPSLLTPLIRSTVDHDVKLVLLHCYPFHREAAYLAAVFPHVYLDVGLAINYTGASSAQVIAEVMELAPFTKVLYSSDAFGLAELFYLGALLFRAGLAATLNDWIRTDHCSTADAEHIAKLAAAGNAARIYPLPS
jgi:predicted TIM-barrel fold metal-dependent hydrolase